MSTALATRSVPLTGGMVALVDAEDYEAVIAAGPWRAVRERNSHYVVRGWSDRLHTFLTGWPMVDHINCDGLDNRRANLRPADHSQNGANRRLGTNNTSGFKGIYFDKRRRRWRAEVKVRGQKRYLGSFKDPADAARAYDAGARAAFGEYARTNFPQ